MASVFEPPFTSLYRHGFVRCAVAVPEVKIADPHANKKHILECARQADAQGALLTVFPELSLSAYSADDLFHQAALLEACEESLEEIVAASQDLSPLLLVGAPLRFDAKLFICAVAVHHGAILGVVPKSYLPNYREYYEKRQFSAARSSLATEVELCGQKVPFGSLIFKATGVPGFSVFAEICEDLWTPIPASSWGALAGATVLCNLSASNVTVAKAEYREALCRAQSGRCISAYLYAGAGRGESTTDLAWDGHGMIWENARMLASTARYSSTGQVIFADVDVERLEIDRMRMTSFQDSVEDHRCRLRDIRVVRFECELPKEAIVLERDIARFPYVPSDGEKRDERCSEVYSIQVQGLCQRLAATGIEKAVIGVSGGLDSTQALIVTVQSFDRLGLSRENVLAYTMPGLATSDRTHGNALALMDSLGVSAGEIDIGEASRGMLERIGHPFSEGKEIYDVTFENVQAGERASHLFRLANLHGALVVGTGDLSELALGWCTYGVGDQMSHYNVNTSVPKTLIQHLIRWSIQTRLFEDPTNAILDSILTTEISPELIPGSREADQPAQSTEEIVGPFELQDFHLYYLTRYGFRPSKIAYLCHHAWGEVTAGRWPDSSSVEDRRAYDLPTVKRWLEVFLLRFFETSQFKRSAMPNGPKVGSGGSLSPRSDWRAPSDSKADVWLEELRRNTP